MLQYKINFNDINWEEPFEGVKCKIFKHGDKQLRLVVYSKEMAIHWCEKGHYGYILDGTFEIEYQNEKIIYQTVRWRFIWQSNAFGMDGPHRKTLINTNIFFTMRYFSE